jgi:hypothetical protein
MCLFFRFGPIKARNEKSTSPFATNLQRAITHANRGLKFLEPVFRRKTGRAKKKKKRKRKKRREGERKREREEGKGGACGTMACAQLKLTTSGTLL